jgi:hypothetical protein
MYRPEGCSGLMVAPVWEMSIGMAKDGDKLCERYRKSENFGNGGGRVRNRKGN